MTRGSVDTASKARAAALRGDVDTALPALLACAEAGDVSAAASAAELLAYLDRWSEAIPLAGAFVARPFAAYAGNVFDDMARLLAKAAVEAGAWEQVAAVAREAGAKVNAALDSNEMQCPEAKIQAVQHRLSTILNFLAEATETRNAAACAEPIRIFGVVRPTFSREAYDAAIALPRNASAERQLSLAIGWNLDDEILRLYRQLTKPAGFDQILKVARAFVRSDAPEEAWRAIESNWPDWYPVDRAQVAPVAPLTDPLLSPLMTAERRDRLVRTPRAGQAV